MTVPTRVNLSQTAAPIPSVKYLCRPRREPGCGHRIRKLRFEADVERAAHDMLAVLGDAKGRPGEHRIRLGRAIGRKDRCFGLADRIEQIGQEVDHPNVDPRLFPGMMVAEKNAQLVDDPFYRAFIVAVRPLESLAGVRVD